MSTAEITARRIYDSFQLQNLSEEVRRHVAILCLSSAIEHEDAVDAFDAITLFPQEKVARAEKALSDAKEGNWSSTESLCEQLDSRYPWLTSGIQGNQQIAIVVDYTNCPNKNNKSPRWAERIEKTKKKQNKNNNNN